MMSFSLVPTKSISKSYLARGGKGAATEKGKGGGRSGSKGGKKKGKRSCGSLIEVWKPHREGSKAEGRE